MTNALSSVTIVQLRRAANLKEKIGALNKKLASILGGSPTASIKAPKKKRGMSAPGRASVAAAQKARWAKVRNAAKKATSPKVSKKSAPAKKSAVAAKTGNSKTKATVAAATPVAPNAAAS